MCSQNCPSKVVLLSQTLSDIALAKEELVDVSVILPTYNEAKDIDAAVRRTPPGSARDGGQL